MNGATCGRLRLAAPPCAAEAAVPDWLVVGFEAALAFPAGYEPGHDPERTCLHEEGFADVTGAELTATWARHLMAGLDRWQAAGPGRLSADFLARLLDGQDEAGLRRGIDPATGALVLEARRHPSPPATGMNRLPRTIRLDPSDLVVFERAAEPGEWAVPGGFPFWDDDPAALAGKRRQAFRAGFLGAAQLRLVHPGGGGRGERGRARGGGRGTRRAYPRDLRRPGRRHRRAAARRRRSPSPHPSATTRRTPCWRCAAASRMAHCASASAPCIGARRAATSRAFGFAR